MIHVLVKLNRKFLYLGISRILRNYPEDKIFGKLDNFGKFKNIILPCSTQLD